MRHVIVPLITVVSLFLAATTWAEEVSAYDRFRLWNNCGPMSLAVEGLSKRATDIGLTRGAITTSVRSRLRSARLYDADTVVFLSVTVTVVGVAFGTGVKFFKPVRDMATGAITSASTWYSDATGVYGGGGSGYILSSVSQLTDEFIDEYLRVNADACTR